MQGRHIIQKQSLEVVLNGDGDGIALQRDTERIIRGDLLPRLEQLLDGMIPVDRVLVIDQLFLEVADLNQRDFYTEFSNVVLGKMETELKKHLGSINSEKAISKGLSIRQRKLQALLYYLEKGYFPWWTNVKSGTDWEMLLSEIIYEPAIKDDWKAIEFALYNKAVRTRFLHLFKESGFWEIISKMEVQENTALRVFEDDLRLVQSSIADVNLRTEVEMKWKEIVLKHNLSIISKNELHHELGVIIEKYVVHLPGKGYNLRKSFLNPEQKQLRIRKEKKVAQKPAEDDDVVSSPPKPIYHTQEIYLANAGLVIIAPYLPMFFATLQLCEGSILKQTDKAIALLHYLVYGTDRYEEFECTLSKVICGMHPEELIFHVALTTEDIEEADALLAAIISHWQALKSTSPDGLRQSFLQREGRLLFSDNEWQLTVQRQTHDILLGYLPWNISLIKLPWMNHLLKVDWN